jgi:transposase, IS5 family
MSRNYLKGILGDELNIMLAAAAMNFKRVMNLWKTEAIYSWKLTIYLIMVVYKDLFAQKLKMTF